MRASMLILICWSNPILAQINSAEALLRKMYDKYQGKWYHSMTFSQTTENYSNDSLSKTAIWYEAISYPQHFRINFGPPTQGNGVIFANDSSYFFKEHKLIRTRIDHNDITFLLGGMYFYPFSELLHQLRSLDYDLSKFHSTSLSGRKVYVIGAGPGQEDLNQLWIDQKNLVLLRFIKMDDGQKQDALLENHVKLAGGWSETQVRFYVNGKLVQKEIYHDLKADVLLDPDLFNPAKFRDLTWIP